MITNLRFRSKSPKSRSQASRRSRRPSRTIKRAAARPASRRYKRASRGHHVSFYANKFGDATNIEDITTVVPDYEFYSNADMAPRVATHGPPNAKRKCPPGTHVDETSTRCPQRSRCYHEELDYCYQPPPLALYDEHPQLETDIAALKSLYLDKKITLEEYRRKYGILIESGGHPSGKLSGPGTLLKVAPTSPRRSTLSRIPHTEYRSGQPFLLHKGYSDLSKIISTQRRTLERP